MTKRDKKPEPGMYAVESIVDTKVDPETGKEWYLVKWAGYAASDNSWEPEEHLDLVDVPLAADRRDSNIITSIDNHKVEAALDSREGS